MFKRFEDKSLADVCKRAAKELSCSVDDLDYEIVQRPSKGIFGLFSKNAIILVAVKDDNSSSETISKEVIDEPVNENKSIDSSEDNIVNDIPVVEEDNKISSNNNKEVSLNPNLEKSHVVDSFFNKSSNSSVKVKIEAHELEEQIKQLLKNSCFELDTIEVDIEDNIAYVFIDGDDAALLIGKEGYRYNALSYIIFNWINAKYGLYLKLEIAQFLASQQDMITHQLKPVVEHINKEGRGRTRELNGILVQIALEYLRDTFPNKYVAIKRTNSGARYIIINEFNKR